MPSFNLRNLIPGGVKTAAGSGEVERTESKSKGGENSKMSLLGLITDGLSQFTNSGGATSESESGTNFLENFNLDKIPQLIKTLQEA